MPDCRGLAAGGAEETEYEGRFQELQPAASLSSI